MLHLREDHYTITTDDGWQLPMRRTLAPARFDATRRPVLITPGYGMNSFIFHYHPSGQSMVRCLAEAGFEVWTGSFRGQKASVKKRWRADRPGLRSLAERDVPAMTGAVIARTESEAKRVDLVGVSLGGAMTYAHLALDPNNRVGAVITIGSPLRWEEAHPLLKVAFWSRFLVGVVPMKGSDRMARMFFPLIARVPGALSIYINIDHIDLTDAEELMKTIDVPSRRINRHIALWMRHHDMVLSGVNITTALGGVDKPLLVIHTNRDQIVPEPVCLSVTRAWGGDDVTVLKIGDDEDWYAHADLFMAPHAPELVFGPMADWLTDRQAI
ncbi:MAG: pimeloyl-ACP methyl ester carboxylesterase [Myxococcota bacterium]|jgi:pimeloyl-ACP methyl ester carboxylesterase